MTKKGGKRIQPGTAKKEAFLLALSKCGIVSHACTMTRIPRQRVYKWRARSPKFAQAWDDAIQVSNEALEVEARRRAMEGVRKPVYQGGRRVGFVQDYSDTLLIFLMKGNMPDKYKDRVQQEHSGPGGGPIEITDDARERLASRIAGVAAKLGAGADTEGPQQTGG
ncbi:MAG: terminase [Bacillota bacterium]